MVCEIRKRRRFLKFRTANTGGTPRVTVELETKPMMSRLIQCLLVLLPAVAAVGLVIAGLWAWQSGDTIVALMGARQPEGVLRGVRCAGVGLVALAQAILLWGVVGRIYRRDRLSTALALSALAVFMLSAGAAVALGLSGR